MTPEIQIHANREPLKPALFRASNIQTKCWNIAIFVFAFNITCMCVYVHEAPARTVSRTLRFLSQMMYSARNISKALCVQLHLQ